jgi:hypothetical protein
MSVAAEHFPVLWPVTSEACSIEKPFLIRIELETCDQTV